MSCFARRTMPNQAQVSDPSKHVNYMLGMVLGVDDFTQEFAYLSGRDQWLARDLLGYGTVCGLEVAIGGDIDKGPRVEVGPGAALTPRGQLVRVDDTYCAYLNRWLADNQGDVGGGLSAPAGETGDWVTLYLMLCYRDCLVDPLPMPGEPCRTEDQVFSPSRLQDSFRLELSLQAPDQREEDALRDFVDWLRQVELREALPANPRDHLRSFKDAVRAAARPAASPVDYMIGSPPEDLYIPGEQACEYLREAFRIWTTELRPDWLGVGAACGTPPAEECLLLAALNLPVEIGTVSGDWIVDESRSLNVDEERRPTLLHLRMLQEWLLCWRTHLTPGDTVVEERTFGQLASAGLSELYSRADHTHGTPDLPDLAGDVSGPIEDNTLVAIQGTPVAASSPVALQAGQTLALVESGAGLEWQPASLEGEVSGPLDENRVVRVQGLPVSQPDQPPHAGNFHPAEGDVLTLQTVAGQLEWQARPAQGAAPDLAGDVSGPIADNTLVAIQGTPVTASSPVTLQAGQLFQLVSAAGGLEWQPRTLGGDLGASPDQAVVNGILNLPVIDPTGQPSGSFLRFMVTHWEVGPGGGGVEGAFVERPEEEGRYRIVAAGTVEFRMNFGNNDADANVLNPYNQLDVPDRLPAPDILLTFDNYVHPDGQRFFYVVKVTPWILDLPFTVFFVDFTGEGFIIRIHPLLPDFVDELSGRVMVEVSQYELEQ